MNTPTFIPPATDDALLVERSLSGDTEAFGSIVERHQSLVCGLAYSACGNVHVSEDLAQETFIAAWRQMGTLREKGNLRGWLCGIARNVIHAFLRRQQRTPTAKAASLDDVAPPSSEEPLPDERVISEQETAMLWHALQTLPPNYREPMVLYYRQQESVSAVAESLELSEDVVKQRLARGRAMLAEHVERLLGNTLRMSRPSHAFTLAVLAALPLAATSASAAVALGAGTTGATFAKGGAAGGKLLTLTAFTAVLAPVLAIFGAGVGYKVSMDSARSDVERGLIKRFYRIVAFGSVVFGAVVLVLAISGNWLAKAHPAVFAVLLIGLVVTSLLIAVSGIIWASRKSRTLPLLESDEAGAEGLPPGKWGVPFMEYRSKLTLFGLPLIHMRFGRKRGEPVTPVKAWFAVGDFAIGVIAAFGAMTIAPISIGGCALGLFSLGGLAFGVACWGGIGVGVWAVGGLALGWMAFGGCVVGWEAAQGALVVAREFALGSAAVAEHANDAVAKSALQSNAFFALANNAMNYAIAINLVWFFPLLLMWRKSRRMKRQGSVPA